MDNTFEKNRFVYLEWINQFFLLQAERLILVCEDIFLRNGYLFCWIENEHILKWISNHGDMKSLYIFTWFVWIMYMFEKESLFTFGMD